MLHFKQSQAQSSAVIIATLPGFNHLKKAIFELKKAESFSSVFDIKYVITKVSCRNFYFNKNRNYLQYLIENCMKGVSNAVIVENQNMPTSEVNLILRTLKNANFERNVIITSGKTFDVDQLAKVLCYQNEKFSILYNKYFYGFEKEGRSQYFLSNAVKGYYFSYRYPFNEVLIQTMLPKVMNVALSETFIDKKVRLKTKAELEAEDKAKKDEELKLSQMEERERKRYLREKRKKEQLEEDLAQEVML